MRALPDLESGAFDRSAIHPWGRGQEVVIDRPVLEPISCATRLSRSHQAGGSPFLARPRMDWDVNIYNTCKEDIYINGKQEDEEPNDRSYGRG